MADSTRRTTNTACVREPGTGVIMGTNKSFPVYPTGGQRLLDAQGTTHYESPVLGAALGIWCLQLHLTPPPRVRRTQPSTHPYFVDQKLRPHGK